jgi:hypothetical protein
MGLMAGPEGRLVVADDRFAGRVDGHAHQRVDDEGIAATSMHRQAFSAMSGLIGRKLGNQGFA